MDVNNDGLNELVVYFDPAQTGLQPGVTSATLTGGIAGSVKLNGQSVPGFQGSDWVVPQAATNATGNATQVQEYSAGPGDLTSICFSPAGPGTGGACFSVPPTSSTVSVAVNDLSGNGCRQRRFCG